MSAEIPLGQRLKELRTAASLDVPSLAEASGVSKAYIWQIESGRRKTPSGEVLLRLARELGTTVSDLMGAEEENTEVTLDDLPNALREFVERKGKKLRLRKEDVEVLKSVRYRGRRPRRMEDYELLHLFIKRIVE